MPRLHVIKDTRTNKEIKRFLWKFLNNFNQWVNACFYWVLFIRKDFTKDRDLCLSFFSSLFIVLDILTDMFSIMTDKQRLTDALLYEGLRHLYNGDLLYDAGVMLQNSVNAEEYKAELKDTIRSECLSQLPEEDFFV